MDDCRSGGTHPDEALAGDLKQFCHTPPWGLCRTSEPCRWLSVGAYTTQFDTLDAVILFYIGSAARARQGTLRNAAAELQGIALTQQDSEPLVVFLKSLHEDYQ